MKICRVCNIEITEDNCYLFKGALITLCKLCSREKTKQYKIENRERVRIHKRKFKEKDSGLYRKYSSITNRCFCKSSGSYKYYGARGITCLWTSYKSFKEDMFDSFIQHVKDFGIKNTTIERNDIFGNYCKENCRWATWEEQQRNKRQRVSKV